MDEQNWTHGSFHVMLYVSGALVLRNKAVSMKTFRLHHFPESVNSYKLALMLTFCGKTFEPVWTDFRAGITWTPEWRRTVNEMGEIPVLEIELPR